MATGKKFCRGCQKQIGARQRICPHCGYDHKAPYEKQELHVEVVYKDAPIKPWQLDNTHDLPSAEFGKSLNPKFEMEPHRFNDLKGKLLLIYAPGIGLLPDLKLTGKNARKWLEALLAKCRLVGLWPSARAVRILAVWAGADDANMKTIDNLLMKWKRSTE